MLRLLAVSAGGLPLGNAAMSRVMRLAFERDVAAAAEIHTCEEAQAYIDANCTSPTPAPTPCDEDDESCEAWADPHISGFDNARTEGPDYLSLLADDGRDIGRLNYRTFFTSFDKRKSELYRRPHKQNKSAEKNIGAEADLDEPDGDEGNRSLDVNAYDSGDFWLVKSIPVHIQGRFRLAQEFLPDNAAIGAVAIGGPFLSGHTFVIEPLDGEVTLDGVPLPTGDFSQSSEAGNITMKYFDSPKKKAGLEHADFGAELPMGVKLKLRRWNRHLDIKITLPKHIPGGVDGECGNMNGNSDDDGQAKIKDRMGQLTIEDKDKLFMKKFNVWVKFDEQGFGAVQATGENRTMERFIRLLLANRGAQLMSESELSGLIPYYTGQEEMSSYDDLLAELRNADWVKGFDTDGSWLFGPVKRLVNRVRKSIMGGYEA